jgi:hypothetical protein
MILVLKGAEGHMNAVALWIVLAISQRQVSPQSPVTIEVQRDVKVRHNSDGREVRGALSLNDKNAKPFLLKKGQRFRMIRIGQEGSCRIRIEKKEYDLTSCPWVEGFTDHQSDIYRFAIRGFEDK